VLHERSDFTDLLTQVGDSSGAGAGIVEKDYWVTEALRVIAGSFFNGVVFKGGTSLSPVSRKMLICLYERMAIASRPEARASGT
jgi:hypothetical protein